MTAGFPDWCARPQKVRRLQASIVQGVQRAVTAEHPRPI